jgi:hypothetical protein
MTLVAINNNMSLMIAVRAILGSRESSKRSEVSELADPASCTPHRRNRDRALVPLYQTWRIDGIWVTLWTSLASKTRKERMRFVMN